MLKVALVALLAVALVVGLDALAYGAVEMGQAFLFVFVPASHELLSPPTQVTFIQSHGMFPRSPIVSRQTVCIAVARTCHYY